MFQAVVATAVRLCGADQAGIYRYEEGEYRWAFGYSQLPEYERIEREVKIRPGTGTLVGRVALEGRPVQILDAWTDPLYEAKADARVGGIHTLLGVPLLRESMPIGVIGLGRCRIERYTERQIELVRTFADQAVIAIGSVETFKALQERTAELTRSVSELEALEGVLRAVNSSLDLDTVLTTIVSRAVQLSRADEGTIYEYDVSEQVFVPKSAFGMSAERVAALRERRIKLGETHLGRSAILRAPVYVEDVQQDPSWRGNAHHQSMIQAWTKLEFAWGLATCMAEAIGATDPVTQQMLGEICSYAELTKAAVHYGEDGAYEYGNGAWFLDHKPLDALRATLPFWFPRVNEIIRLIGSHNVLCTPTSAQFADLTFAPTDRQIPPRGWGHHGGGSRPHLPPRLGRACQPQRAV